MRLRPLLLCLLLAPQVQAQAPAPAAAPLVRAQPSAPADAPLLPGPTLELEVDKPVRILRGSLLLEGRLMETSPQFLTLDSGVPGAEPVHVPLSDVLELSVRERSPGSGALIGGSAGLATGFLAGMAVCAIAEGDTSGQCAAAILITSSTFTAAGAGLGALIGLLIPHWERVYERVLDGPLVLPPAEAPREEPQEGYADEDEDGYAEADADEPPKEARKVRGPPRTAIAQLSLLAASVLTIDEPDDAIGPGLRIEGLAQLNEHFAVGPEVAFHYLLESLDGGGSLNEGMFTFGVLMRASMSPRVVTPSLLIGFSLHTLGQPATYSIGGALDWEGPYGLPLALELRWHQFNVPWKDGRQLTFGAGTRLYW